MKLFLKRDFVLARLQERIKFLEVQRDEAKEKEAKMKKLEEIELGEVSPPGRLVYGFKASAKYESELQIVRFTVEHLPQATDIETDLGTAVVLGLVDTTRDGGYGSLV